MSLVNASNSGITSCPLNALTKITMLGLITLKEQLVGWQLLQISAFFLFSNFRKRQIALYSPCRLVGRSVGRLVDVTINFFNIYRHKSPLLTQYHSIPISTKLYWPSTTKLQPVSPHTDPVPSITNQYCPVIYPFFISSTKRFLSKYCSGSEHR